MDRCKCGSFAINEHAHGRIKGKHSDLCDVCYWREEAKQARREGWEQAARECAEIADQYKIIDNDDTEILYGKAIGDDIRITFKLGVRNDC